MDISLILCESTWLRSKQTEKNEGKFNKIKKDHCVCTIGGKPHSMMNQ